MTRRVKDSLRGKRMEEKMGIMVFVSEKGNAVQMILLRVSRVLTLIRASGADYGSSLCVLLPVPLSSRRQASR